MASNFAGPALHVGVLYVQEHVWIGVHQGKIMYRDHDKITLWLSRADHDWLRWKQNHTCIATANKNKKVCVEDQHAASVIAKTQNHKE